MLDDRQSMPGAGANAIAERWGFDVSIQETNALLRRLLDRWTRQEAEDDAEWTEFFGPLLDAQQAAPILGVKSVESVAEMARDGKLLALPTRDGRVVFPAFQFGKAGAVYPEIERIIAIFADIVVTPYTIASWLLGPKEYLQGHSPIRWLELGGDPERVIAGAEVAAARLAQ
jgi:hypothetical protein